MAACKAEVPPTSSTSLGGHAGLAQLYLDRHPPDSLENPRKVFLVLVVSCVLMHESWLKPAHMLFMPT